MCMCDWCKVNRLRGVKAISVFLNTTDFNRIPQNYRLLSQELRSKVPGRLPQLYSSKSFPFSKPFLVPTFPHLNFSASSTAFLLLLLSPTTSSLFFRHASSSSSPSLSSASSSAAYTTNSSSTSTDASVKEKKFRVTSHLTNPVKHRRLFRAT